MAETTKRDTAKIIPFPVKARAAKATQHDASWRTADNPARARVEFGSGWYHDAAIADAEQASRR
jgi:hypothetical protein